MSFMATTVSTLINKAKDLSRDEKAKCNRLLQQFPEHSQWREMDHAGTCVYGAKFSIFEIKCPEAKYIHRSLPITCANFILKWQPTTCVNVTLLAGIRRMVRRVEGMELTFNDAFWRDFVKIVDLFRMKIKMDQGASLGLYLNRTGLH